MPVDICYLVSHGFAARMVLQSGLLPTLKAAGISCAIVVPDVAEEAARDIEARHEIPVFAGPPLSDWRQREYQIIRRYLFEDVKNNPSLWAKHNYSLDQKLSRRVRFVTYMGLNRLSVRFGLFRRMLERVEKWLLVDRRASGLLEKIEPTVVVSTYPVSPLESHFVFEANRMGLTTVGHLLSWDNITSKGRFPSVPDYFLTWGPIMSEEAKSYYGTPESNIYPCGVAHFDHHLKEPSPDDITLALTRLGLRGDRPYVFFGMSSPYIAPREIDVVEELSRWINEGKYGPQMQLVIRPHPQNVQGTDSGDESWIRRLKSLAGPRVGLNYPAMSANGLSWNLEEHDMDVLVSLIHGSAVTLNSGSTLAIDAMMQDKPVVITAFDGDAKLPWYQSAGRILTFDHLKKLLSLGGATVVQSFDELDAAIEAYLNDPTLHQEGRAMSIHQECGTPGETVDRIVAALSDVLHRIEPTRSVDSKTIPYASNE